MKNIYFILLFFSLSLTATGQISSLFSTGGDMANSDLITYKAYSNYKGSPYYQEDFASGYVTLKNGENKSWPMIKLDLYKNSVILSLEDVGAKALDNVMLAGLYLSGKKNGMFKLIKLDGEDRWAKVLIEGQVNLLKLYDISIEVENRQAATSYSGNTDINEQIFKKKIKYFWTEDYSSFQKVSSNSKDFISTFQNKKSNISTFLKDNKLKPRKEEDLIEIFNELNRV